MKKILLCSFLLLAGLEKAGAQFINDGWHTKPAMPDAKWGVGSASYQVGAEGRLVPVSGGNAAFAVVPLVQQYSSTTNSWSNLPNVPLSRIQVNSFYNNNKIFFIGGYTGGFTPTNTVSIFDIATSTWSTGAPMLTAVGDYASAQNGDLIYIMCGYNGSVDVTTVQVYNTVTNTWALATPFNGIAVGGGRAGIAKGKIVFVGGYNQVSLTQSQARLGTIDPGNPLLITWTVLPNYPAGPAGRHAAGAVRSPLNTTVYFTGGDPNGGGTSFMNATWGYDVVENVWKPGPNKPTAVSNIMSLAPIVANDTLFYACNGGYSGVVQTANEWLKIGRASGITTTVTGNPTKCINAIDTIVATNLDTNLRWQSSTDNVSFTFIAGPTGTNDTLFTGPLTQNTWFRVVSYGHVDSAISASFAVTVLQNVAISSQPSPQSVCAGAGASFSVTATGAGLNYQWRKNGNPISNGPTFTGVNTPNLSISNATNEAGSYDVIITGTCSTLGSNAATLTVNQLPTATLTNNGAATICDGDATGIDINFTGSIPFDFTYFDGNAPVPVTGWASNTFTFPVTPGSTESYYVTAITDGNGCAAGPGGLSDVADVTVHYVPAITTDPASITACTGAATSLSVVATGGGLNYQWYNGVTPLTNTSPYSGADADILNINNASGLDGSVFYVEVSNICGTLNSANATLTEDFENTWIGGTGTAWSTVANWSCGSLPTSATNVTIPNTAATMPDVDIPTAICNNITIDAGSDIEFSGSNNQLEVRGNITNNGDFDGTDGKVLLAGTTQQLSGPLTFGNLEIAGGNNKTLMDDITVTGILSLTNGTVTLGDNNLTLNMPWSQLGGSATSFIVTNDVGAVIGTNMGTGGNPDAVTFHIGINGTSYTPVTLENTGDADTFTVMVIEHVYVDGDGTDPAQVDNPVVDRTWMISENTPGGSFATITPQWNAGDETGGFDLTHVYVAHYMNSEWTSEIDSAIWAQAAGGTDPYTATEDSITSFSPFAVASYAQFPLAIRLTTISAVNAGSSNKVEWKSAKETTGDRYELERSTTGKDFAQITAMKANGTASTYTYLDATPVTGVNYYRVKMVNANGKSSYSKVVTATVSTADNFSIEAYPNPIEHTVSIQVNGTINGTGNVVITDVTGRVVKSATKVVDNRAEINVSNLASGIYLLNYTDNVRNESIKINKR